MLPALTPQNLLENLSNAQKCTTGCPILDRCLGGGIPGNSLTEFPFPFRRLHQLSISFRSSNSRTIENPSDNIFVPSVDNAHQLLGVMSKTESFISNSRIRFPIRVIVIDSIAALFRSEFENTPVELKRRSSLFFKISAKLKELAKRYNLVVLVTNQVGDLIGPDGVIHRLRIGNLGCLYSSGRRVCPALGLAWANCVNSRLFLSRYEEIVSGEDGNSVEGNGGGLLRRMRRQLHVVFPPHLGDSSCEFVIKRGGVWGIER